jgi:hypothetical protein
MLILSASAAAKVLYCPRDAIRALLVPCEWRKTRWLEGDIPYYDVTAVFCVAHELPGELDGDASKTLDALRAWKPTPTDTLWHDVTVKWVENGMERERIGCLVEIQGDCATITTLGGTVFKKRTTEPGFRIVRETMRAHRDAAAAEKRALAWAREQERVAAGGQCGGRPTHVNSPQLYEAVVAHGGHIDLDELASEMGVSSRTIRRTARRQRKTVQLDVRNGVVYALEKGADNGSVDNP